MQEGTRIGECWVCKAPKFRCDNKEFEKRIYESGWWIFKSIDVQWICTNCHESYDSKPSSCKNTYTPGCNCSDDILSGRWNVGGPT